MHEEIALVSIQHTGTELILQAIERAGWERVGLDAPPQDKPMCRFAHITPETQEKLRELAKQDIVMVIPIRHPWRVEQSWRRRCREGDLWGMWRFMFNELAWRWGTFLVPVDAPGVRESCVEGLGEKIGGKLLVNWRKPVNTSGQRDGDDRMITPLDELRPSDEARQMARHKFVESIYDGV